MRVLVHRALGAFLGLTFLILSASAQAPAQKVFATPDDAAKALQTAFKTDDIPALTAMFGTDVNTAFSSGDATADKNDRQTIALAMGETWRWVPLGATKKQLIIGDEAWPFPIPLAKVGSGYQFDTKAGEEEVLARRVGRNELNVIQLCRTYVDIQENYAGQGHDGKPSGLYAQKIASTPSTQDGLYWAVKTGEPPSPMGDLAAQAEAVGYQREKTPNAPFMGYYFRVLTEQGPAAPGGARSYIVDGNMSDGFALIAYPAKYGYSGVMTFIVNQSGIVYQKDLGKDTDQIASGIKAYNPDTSWTMVP
ncbi:MAG TPA: DUF2950 domain-containing protein [Candidatus Angelobacter sp.]|nr:DUF2950 domain-containing protein [Candidatus Angelobacter sp.]